MRMFAFTSGPRLALLATALVSGLFAFKVHAAPTPTGQPVAYVLTTNNTITAVDTGSHAVLRTISLPAAATNIVGTPDGRQLYVATNDTVGNPNNTGVVWVVDTQTSEIIRTIPLDLFPVGMAISSDGSRVYALSALSVDYAGYVTVIDTASNTVVTTLNDSYADSVDIALAPNNQRLYVANHGDKANDGSLDVFNLAGYTGTGLTPESMNQFSWVAVAPDSSKFYSLGTWINGDTYYDGIAVFDAATNQQTGTSSLPVTARLIRPLPNSSIIYGVNATGNVLAYNTQTDTVVATVPVAVSAALALTPDGSQLYAISSNALSIAIIDTATNALAGSVAVAGASAITIVPAPPAPVLVAPVLSLQLSPTTVLPGAQSVLTWTSTGATSCAASGALTGSVALEGQQDVSAAAPGSYTYILTCTGAGGTTAASAKLSVVSGSTFTANATDLPVRSSVTLSWQAFAGATSCSASGAWSGTLPPSGSKTVGPFNQAGTLRFQLTCMGVSNGDQLSTSVSLYGPAVFKGTPLLPPNDNVYAVGSPGTAVSSGGLDGHGYAYDSQQLPSPLTALGQTFTIGALSKPTGISNQVITLTAANLVNLTLLATGVNGPQLNQAFVVTYTDGTTKTFTQSLSDWGKSGNYAGETVAASTNRITAAGATQGGTFNIFAYALALDDNKIVKSLQLPKNRDVIVLAINETRAPQATADSIASAFNVYGLATAGHATTNSGLDGHGYAFDSALLPSGFSGAGQTFTLGAANAPDAVSNALITLAAKSRVGLTVLATAINGSQPNQSFVVKYSDGSTTVFTQSVSDWNTPQNYANETLARNTALRITPTGTTQGGVWDVYAYTLLTDASKQVVSLTLPKSRNVVVFAVNSMTQ